MYWAIKTISVSQLGACNTLGQACAFLVGTLTLLKEGSDSTTDLQAPLVRHFQILLRPSHALRVKKGILIYMYLVAAMLAA